MKTKQCSIKAGCGKTHPVTFFNKHSGRKDGYNSVCKECKSNQARIYRENNKDNIKERKKKFYRNNEQSILENKKRYYKENKEIIRKKQEIHYNNNKEYFIEKANNRKFNKLNATPAWSQLDKIKVLYKKAAELEKITGLKYHVDHIIPLQSDLVCGLHVWENLQILEANENISKSNKFDLKKHR